MLDFFLDHKEFDYSVAEIAQKTELSLTTVVREIPHLEKTRLIIHNRKVGKSMMYKLDTNFKAVSLLDAFVLEMSQIPFLDEPPRPEPIQHVLDEHKPQTTDNENLGSLIPMMQNQTKQENN